MTPAWDEKSVFLAALELPVGQREEFLARSCPNDATRERIKALLQHHQAVTEEILDATPPGQSTPPPSLPDRIDEFQIVRLLGEGGMGVVYLAEDLILGRRVALKILSPGLMDSEKALTRFRTEARSTAAINHPGIVPVYKSGVAGALHYIACEYVDGPTLAQVIENERGRRSGHVDPVELRKWYRQAAETIGAVAVALEAAHRHQIVHCDVKPSNILMDRDRGPRLTDFGVARRIQEEGGVALTAVIGSCHYMSPEQAEVTRTTVDQRSDIFSLGVVLYELICLRRPFTGASQNEILRAVAELDPTRLRQIDNQVPRELEIICRKAMEKRPQDRYSTAGHVAADLRCFLEGRPILATPPSVLRRAKHWATKKRQPLLIAACIVLALGGAVLSRMLKHARNEQLASFSVESAAPDCRVLLQQVNPDTYETETPPELLGSTPLHDVLRPVGQYRVIVQQLKSRLFAEFNVILRHPGRANKLKLFAHDCSKRSKIESDGHVREGYLCDPGDQRNRDMVLIPGDSYTIGWSDQEKGGLVERRQIQLPAFYMDRFEVSNREYKDFVESTGYRLPPHWERYGYDSGRDEFPLLSVRLEDAEAYARWRGKRLPSALEWQAAARTAEGWAYPWGGDWQNAPPFPPLSTSDQRDLESWDEWTLYKLHNSRTVPVRSADPCPTPTGILHLFGNVRELTGSVELPNGVVLMGRGWADTPAQTTLAHPRMYLIDGHDFQNGFRCARSADVPPSNP